MLPTKLIVFCVFTAFITGCASTNKTESFQIYAPRTDCVSCKKQEKWGFVKKLVYRNKTVAFFASFEPKTTSSRQLERIGLCYGTALDTIKSGATHFRILSREKFGDWYVRQTPASISSPDISGASSIYMGGSERVNRDQSGMWWTNHYYEIGSPSCGSSKDSCSKKHGLNLQDCPYVGEDLRKETEEKKGSLACVMKRNPRLLLHDVYSSEGGCGSTMDGIPEQIANDFYRMAEVDYWIPANDVIKKYEVFFRSDE